MEKYMTIYTPKIRSSYQILQNYTSQKQWCKCGYKIVQQIAKHNKAIRQDTGI
jgi:hypothetical protein